MRGRAATAAGALLLVSALAGVLLHHKQEEIEQTSLYAGGGDVASGLDDLGVADFDDAGDDTINGGDAGKVEYSDVSSLDSLAGNGANHAFEPRGEAYADQLFDKGPTKMALMQESNRLTGGRLGKIDHQLAQEQHYLNTGSDEDFYAGVHGQSKYNKRVINGLGGNSRQLPGGSSLKPLWQSDDLVDNRDVGGIAPGKMDDHRSDLEADDLELSAPHKASTTSLAIEDQDGDEHGSDSVNFQDQAKEKANLMRRLAHAESRLRRSLDIITT
jgi:hypothetical protein